MDAKMKIIDMHCDTLMESWKHPENSFYDGPTYVNLKNMKETGSLAQCFAMYLPWKNSEKSAYEILNEMYANYKVKMEENKELIRPAYSAKDILKNAEKGFLSSFLTIEDAAFMDGKAERLGEAFDMGVRMIGLIWNYENCIGYPNSSDEKEHMRGLKPFGIETIEHMDEFGIIIDCSHLNEGGFYDVARHTKNPFVCSHSCARELCDHRRNLTDDQLKTIGNKGGIVGVNFYGHFLNNDGASPTAKRIAEHLVYMKDKAGIDAIGFGSDLDGIDDNGEIVNYSGFRLLLDEMSKHFTDDEIDKISHLNALRVIREVTGA